MIVLSNFNNCPLKLIFCNKSANKTVNRAHKCVLMILHSDYDSSFQSLLKRSNSFTIQVKNLQLLIIQVNKALNSTNPSIVSEFFEKVRNHMILGRKSFAKIP